MGRRTSRGPEPADPLPRRKIRTPGGKLIRGLSIVIGVLAALFLVAGFYYSGVIRNDALRPPTIEPTQYTLEVVNVGPETVTVKGSAENDQLDQKIGRAHV